MTAESYFTKDEPIRIGDETQMLLDDTIVEDRWRLTRVMHSPLKYPHNPILTADKPWESDVVYAPNVIYDESLGRYRMWYLCWNNSNYYYGSGPVSYIAYAESDDGYHWEKPLMDYCPFGRYKKTNIVYYGTHDQGPYYGAKDPSLKLRRVQMADLGQVFRDDDDPDPQKRYKMITIEGQPMPQYHEVHCGVNLVCSPDGFRWRLASERPSSISQATARTMSSTTRAAGAGSSTVALSSTAPVFRAAPAITGGGSASWSARTSSTGPIRGWSSTLTSATCRITTGCGSFPTAISSSCS